MDRLRVYKHGTTGALDKNVRESPRGATIATEPTPTPTATPTATPTPTPTRTAPIAPAPTPTLTSTSTPSPTLTPSITPTPSDEDTGSESIVLQRFAAQREVRRALLTFPELAVARRRQARRLPTGIGQPDRLQRQLAARRDSLDRRDPRSPDGN